jgi:23S rRNA (adenine2503-C2)-methyltransferase
LIDVLDLSASQLAELLKNWDEPVFRARQLDRWIYRELAVDYDTMSNLPHALRERLADESRIGSMPAIAEATSADGLTRKALLRLEDGQSVETVLMMYADAPASPELEEPASESGDYKRRTVCISTQVGCPIRCPFCETGQAGYIRNLTAGEIVAQVLHFARVVRPDRLTNVVFMGMGEPFFKFDVTWQAILALTDPNRFGLGARRITVSTSGEIPGIQRLAAEPLQVNLAISLHAAEDDLRDVLVPLNRKYPLRELMRAARAYTEQTRRRVTFEYALMDGVNDHPDQARGLSQMLRGLLCHVNLIPLNPTTETHYGRTPYKRVKAFEKTLQDAGIPTTLRVEKGIEISAGCGQLRQSAPAVAAGV